MLNWREKIFNDDYEEVRQITPQINWFMEHLAKKRYSIYPLSLAQNYTSALLMSDSTKERLRGKTNCLRPNDYDLFINKLTKAETIDEFLNENGDLINAVPFYERLEELLKWKNMTKPLVFERAGIHPLYGYQFFSGKRHPTRDKVLQLAIAFRLSHAGTQELLTLAGKRGLYPLDERDAIILFAFTHDYKLDQLQEMLFDKSLPLLGEIRT
ncbi:MAG: helix-turn-helix domain-containing protein [Oscillospiraceae bacterium]|nr:helix-turn-helix domain-containing protein [Oscillospiraceae bacterium]